MIAVLGLVLNMPGCVSPFHSAARAEAIPQGEESASPPSNKIDVEEKLRESGKCVCDIVMYPFIAVATIIALSIGGDLL